jgi:hypothetical protein
MNQLSHAPRGKSIGNLFRMNKLFIALRVDCSFSANLAPVMRAVLFFYQKRRAARQRFCKRATKLWIAARPSAGYNCVT